MIYRVLPFDQLIAALMEGRGDIVATGLTITAQRLKKVAFTQPYVKNINEIVVTSKNVPKLKTERALSDRKIYVVAGSSYLGHLKRLNEMLSMEGFEPAKIIEMDKNLEAEDILHMQILPSTAAGPIVGIADIDNVENSIYAGVKYLRYLRDRYFNDPTINLDNQIDFTFAAYNAGPARIDSLRKRAKNKGLDPNRWFFNVEQVARQTIGQETVQYVTNIYMYYIAYRTSLNALEKREKQIKHEDE